MSNWTLFSNHGHVLVCLARNSEARLRDVAADVGITERAVQKIVRDLQDGDMISVTKTGRRNCYRIHKKQSLRHPLEAACNLRDLIKVVNKETGSAPADAVLVNEPVQVVKSKPETLDSKVETGPGSDPESSLIKPKPIKPRSEKVEPAEPKPSDSPERQQGSLF